MYEVSNLAANMKIYRKALGITQSELAKKLYISTQSISKWETGLSFPDVRNLCLLASALSVSIDDLLGSHTSKDEYTLIAIDGGGTKTEFLLYRESGEILSRIILKGINPNVCGVENACAVLREGIDTLLRACPTVSAIYAGIAGCGLKENRDALSAFLSSTYMTISKIQVSTDILNVIYTSEKSENCIAAISGTGSAVYAKCHDTLHRIGGWGYLFDQGGSAYDIGHDGLVAALAENDGIGEHTAITNIIERALGTSVSDNLTQIYKGGNEYVASFAKYVFAAYGEGDKIAAQIIVNSAERLACLINRAIKEYGCDGNVILAGGLIEAQADILMPLIRAKLPKRASLNLAAFPQILGAAIGAVKTFGGYTCAMRERLIFEYTRITAPEMK